MAQQQGQGGGKGGKSSGAPKRIPGCQGCGGKDFENGKCKTCDTPVSTSSCPTHGRLVSKGAKCPDCERDANRESDTRRVERQNELADARRDRRDEIARERMARQNTRSDDRRRRSETTSDQLARDARDDRLLQDRLVREDTTDGRIRQRLVDDRRDQRLDALDDRDHSERRADALRRDDRTRMTDDRQYGEDRADFVEARRRQEAVDDRAHAEVEARAAEQRRDARDDALHRRAIDDQYQVCTVAGCSQRYSIDTTECPKCTLEVEQELEVRQSYSRSTGVTTVLIEYSTKVGSGTWQGQACTVRIVAGAIGLSVEEDIPSEGGSVDISPNSSEFDVVIDVIRAPRGNPKATAMATIRATATRFRKSTRL
jgi:hypothetical protein